jgi:hypothetical protein
MRWAILGLTIGAALLLVPAVVYWRSQRDAENRSTASVYLVPGLIVLGLAALFGAMWLIRHA